MFMHIQSTKYEDLHCLYNRVHCLSDIVAYNITFNLDVKYTKWLERHKDLVEELEFMIKEDLEAICDGS